MKQLFPCGHRGRGKLCHRCAEEERVKSSAAAQQQSERAQKLAQKRAWEASFAEDPIDLRRLPDRELVLKVREVLEAIARGEDYTRFHGKRLGVDRRLISVPIGQRYRLLLRDDGGALRPLSCLTHEEYNTSLRPGLGS